VDLDAPGATTFNTSDYPHGAAQNNVSIAGITIKNKMTAPHHAAKIPRYLYALLDASRAPAFWAGARGADRRWRV
jgi:hypothetical protein